MIPYPACGDDADRVAKMREEALLGAMDLPKTDALGACSEAVLAERPGSSADDVPPVWKRYIDSRLKQFCTR